MIINKLMLSVVFALTSCILFAQTTRYVSLDGGHDTPHFTNWSGAATNIQNAINVAEPGDTVLISNGTYYLTSQIDIALTKTNITIRGLTGNPEDVIIDANNYPGKPVTNRCMIIRGNEIFVEALTFTNGRALGPTVWDYYGGGILVQHSGKTSEISNCRFTGNIAELSGGGVNLVYGTTILRDCEIIGNVSSNRGGGLFVYQQLAPGLVMDGGVIENNRAVNEGGGIYIASSLNHYEIANVTVKNNTAGVRGGGIWLHYGGTVRGCLVVGNVASNYGGGIGQWQWIYTNGTTLVENCTIVLNNANTAGGGLWLRDNDPYTVSNFNNIIWYNTVNSGISSNVFIENAGSATDFYHCAVPPTTAVTAGQGNITDNPKFADWNAGNFRLQTGSPCINSGTNRPWMENAMDMDGHLRLDRFSGKVDMGSFEHIPRGTIFRMR